MKRLCALFLILLSSWSLAAGPEERALQGACSQSDFVACENLTAFYAKTSQWENAFLLGEALCKKEVMKGCTFAGAALLAKGKTKEGAFFLTKSCDGFEPLACRSLARLMKSSKEEVLSYMYNKRACHYGLIESCKKLKKPKTTYSTKGLEFLKDVYKDCEDSNSSHCRSHLSKLDKCNEFLSKEDCLLIPGELSIFFRAKLLQAAAKVSLLPIVEAERVIKESSKLNRFSYDLGLVLEHHKPIQSYQYVFGFMKSCSKHYERRPKVESTSLALYKNAYNKLSSRVKSNISAFFYKGRKEDCYDPIGGFEAFAAANLDPLDPSRLDIWKTNRDGDMIHVRDGLPLP